MIVSVQYSADDIDKTIYNDNNQHRSENSRLLSDYGRNWKTLAQTKEEIAFLEGCIALGNADPSSKTWADKLERAQDKLETITHAAHTPRSGPPLTCETGDGYPCTRWASFVSTDQRVTNDTLLASCEPGDGYPCTRWASSVSTDQRVTNDTLLASYEPGD
ncbi:hypothetical protein RRG08_025488 [Elysia crispata]|uniref:Uncharacterized protein n=1 Tax=Elysia crispata TaxID=231223 RepID=A0AAE0Y211_9GAST|nr:hypothetical protein RRG08_025488 [Elysia crispata]